MLHFSSTRLICFAIVIFSHSLSAATYHGIGISSQLHTAKKLALADLQQNMYVEIETLTEVTSAAHHGNHYRMSSKISSSLKILGAQPHCQLMDKDYECRVQLGQQDIDKYRVAIQTKVDAIDKLWSNSQAVSGEAKLSALETALLEYENLKPLVKVYQLLNPQQPLKLPSVSPTQLQYALAKLQNDPDSLSALAAHIASKYQGFERIFVRPFTQPDALSISPLSQALQTEISGRVNAISDREYAFYELTGNYTDTETGVQISAQLINITREGMSEVAAASSHHIRRSYIAQYKTETKQPEFEQSLKQNIVDTGELKLQLRTNRGQRDLLFNQGETVVLQIKSNQIAHYHLIGHSHRDDAEFSYLLDLNDASGKQKFVQHIDESQVNRWVTIGEFVVHPPFGVESLQALGYSNANDELVPNATLDGSYYVIDGKPLQVVQKTRGLVRKYRSEKAAVTSNATSAELAKATPLPVSAPLETQVPTLNTLQLSAKKQPKETAEAILQFTTRARQ